MEIRPVDDICDARTVEEMRVALRVEQDRGRFPIRFAQKTVRGTGNQPMGRITVLHQFQQCLEPIRGQGEIFPHGRQVVSLAILMSDTEYDQPGEDGLGLLVPMRLLHLSWRAHSQGIGQSGGILVFWIHHDHRALRREQVRNYGANALTCSRGGESQQMGRAVIAEQLAGGRVATNQKAVAGLQAGQLLSVSKLG